MKKAPPPATPLEQAWSGRRAPSREERADIEERFQRGELPLGDALLLALGRGEPVPPAIAQAVMVALREYDTGMIKDLAEGLGIARPYSERKQVLAEQFRSQVRDAVRYHHESGGLPNVDPARGTGLTASHKAAEELGISPHTAFAIFKGKR